MFFQNRLAVEIEAGGDEDFDEFGAAFGGDFVGGAGLAVEH